MKHSLLFVVGIFVSLSIFATPVDVSIIKSNKPRISLSQRPDYLQPGWSARNKEQGELFLAANKLKSDVFTLPGGLQYRIIKGGLGNNPTVNDAVIIKYRGRFIPGHVFDNRFYGKKSLWVPVAQLIPGIRQAVLLMKPGSIWELYIAPELAFGEQGLPGIIGSNMTLIYTVQLLNVQPRVDSSQTNTASP